MARSGINYHDVAKTAQKIVGQGKAPTIELIRAQLGTGSNSTTTNATSARRLAALITAPP